MASPGKQFRDLMYAPEILIQPGVYDGYTARLVEHSGFKTASISGAGVSESRMGWADRGIMTFDENLNNARRLADCTNLLLRADADTGYGNAMTVHFVVRAFEKASGREVPCEIVARRPGDVDACYADPARARELLGWQARRDIDAMCADSWRWQRMNPHGYAREEAA